MYACVYAWFVYVGGVRCGGRRVGWRPPVSACGETVPQPIRTPLPLPMGIGAGAPSTSDLPGPRLRGMPQDPSAPRGLPPPLPCPLGASGVGGMRGPWATDGCVPLAPAPHRRQAVRMGDVPHGALASLVAPRSSKSCSKLVRWLPERSGGQDASHFDRLACPLLRLSFAGPPTQGRHACTLGGRERRRERGCDCFLGFACRA